MENSVNLPSTVVNEVIVTGRKKRRLIDKAAKLWQRISYWTKACDVEFDDGKTAQQKVGNINGITSDFFVKDENIAASSNLTNKVYKRFYDFTANGKVIRFVIGEDGKLYIEYQDGADTVLKKLGSSLDADDPDSIVTSKNSEYTTGTWLRIYSITAKSDNDLYFIQKKLSITDPDKNSIKKIGENYRSQGGDENNRLYGITYMYLVTVETDTAAVESSFSPSTSASSMGYVLNIKVSD